MNHELYKMFQENQGRHQKSQPIVCPMCAKSAAATRFCRAGFFVRKCDGERVQRLKCLECGNRFSKATPTLEFRQQKRAQNFAIFQELSSAVSIRRTATNTGLNRKTVAHRLQYFEKYSRIFQEFLASDLTASDRLSTHVQFDDMETYEHTKLKPVSVALLVCKDQRYVLGVETAAMPANGLTAALSREKYGRRKDDRPVAWEAVLKQGKKFIVPCATITSDMHLSYGKVIRKFLPGTVHLKTKGRKPRSAGQGELKKGGFDPLFSLNHTAAMFRANISRLIRKTWCTTKRMDRLRSHLWLYVIRHNFTITATLKKKELGARVASQIKTS
jgi:transposase-like protein